MCHRNLSRCLFRLMSYAVEPRRDPGDAMRHWHRRLDMLADKDKDGDNVDQGEVWRDFLS